MEEVCEMICPKHGKTEFFKSQYGFRCKECRKKAVVDIRVKNKEKLVEYKGGKCEICGYNKCIEALEFHHINPDEKEFGISNGDTRKFSLLKEEVDKCLMLCSNCHRELHAKEKQERKKKIEEEEYKNISIYNIENNITLKNDKNQLVLEDILIDIEKGLSMKDISEKHMVTYKVMKRFLTKNNCYPKFVNKSDNINVDEFIEYFKLYKTFIKVAEIYNISDNGLRKWCKKNNLPMKTKDMCQYLNIQQYG